MVNFVGMHVRIFVTGRGALEGVIQELHQYYVYVFGDDGKNYYIIRENVIYFEELP